MLAANTIWEYIGLVFGSLVLVSMIIGAISGAVEKWKARVHKRLRSEAEEKYSARKQVDDAAMAEARERFEKKTKAAQAEIAAAETKLENKRKEADEVIRKKRAEDLEAIENIFREKTRGFPWVATAWADYLGLRDDWLADYLTEKDQPAYKAAEVVKLVKQEKRQLAIEARTSKYLLEYYETLFPWLTEFREDEIDELIRTQSAGGVDDSEEDFDRVRLWVSDGEYAKLSSVERNQRALDRWKKSRKSKWQIGRDYERYIGFGYEEDGFRVVYHGIIEGFEDMGRDLVCTKGNTVVVVQCKCWA